MLIETHQKVILIIDDNVTNLRVAIQHLEKQGVRIATARNGESGLERAELIQPDLILLDVQMPGIDGFEVCRRLKANETTADIPVIFMTALTDVTDKVRGFEVGAVDYVTKPIEAVEVWARVNAHLSIRTLQQQMAEQIAELDAFAGTVAHDLKNPLARIIMVLDLIESILEDKLDDELSGLMKMSTRSSQTMLQIIDELLLLAQVRQADMETDVIAMEDVVAGAIERVATMMETHEAQLIQPDEWPAAVGYAPWLTEVWVNYLSNGVKYGGRPPRLEVGYTETAVGQTRFWVRDNGEGLSDEDQSKLFKAFSRVYNKNQVEGHGLGLAIVRRIIRRLGGEVGVDSQLGQGSKFYFTLPTSI